MNENNELNAVNEEIKACSENKTPVTAGKKVATVFISILIVLGFILLQALVAGIGLAPKIVGFMTEAAGDPAKYMALYQDYVLHTPVLMHLQFAASLISLIVVAVWYYFGYVRKAKADPDRRTLKKSFKGWPDAVFIFTGTVAIYGLAATISKIIQLLRPQTVDGVGDLLTVALGDGTQLIGLLTGVVLAPVMEEILFRGIILNRSKRAFGAIGCIVLSTLMFSFMHMNIVQGLYVIPMGLFWGYIAYRYKSVIPCVICHFINNFTGMLIPINFPPIILFIVFGCIAAFIGVRYGIVDNKEEIENVSEE